jgi:hypothetical protein
MKSGEAKIYPSNCIIDASAEFLVGHRKQQQHHEQQEQQEIGSQ